MTEPLDLFRLDDLLTDEDLQLRDRIRAWVRTRFVPEINRCWNVGTFPLELVPEIAALGVFGGNIQGYGCSGWNALTYGVALQELERGDTGLRTFASVQGALAMNAIHMFGSDEQKSRWLPGMARGDTLGCFGLTEPNHGSNPGGMETRAIKTSDGYELTGSKMWIGGGTLADVAVVWAKVEGEPGLDSNSPAAIRGFLVERGTPGFQASVIEGKYSLRIGITCRLEFEHCRLPHSALLPGSNGLKSPLQCLNHARYGIAWGVLGAAQACFEEARDYVLHRQQFGKPLGSFQLIQRKLALMATEITSAQLVAHRLAQLKDAGKATFVQISLAKRNNVATALNVARMAREILGGVGILDEHVCFRHMCNLESVQTYEGTDDMHLLILGEHLTGLSAFS
ncbi:MAG: acyl-CoA dehydrogenase family protein [Planctomycetes bacterium]|nr:acyl-CoA dehydrogenase family protein [Planctomycetota bacterium]